MSSANPFSLALEELALLDKQRKALEERAAKVKQLAALAAELYPEQVANQAPPLTSNDVPRQFAVAAARKPREGTSKARITQIAADLIAAKGYVQTSEILVAVEAENIPIGSNDKATYVSGILSRNKEMFASDRSKGWSLANKKPDSAPTLPGFPVANAT
jgi:hypothetical protein